jgi:diguanylate cyclase (GGDEF)-like protein
VNPREIYPVPADVIDVDRSLKVNTDERPDLDVADPSASAYQVAVQAEHDSGTEHAGEVFETLSEEVPLDFEIPAPTPEAGDGSSDGKEPPNEGSTGGGEDSEEDDSPDDDQNDEPDQENVDGAVPEAKEVPEVSEEVQAYLDVLEILADTDEGRTALAGLRNAIVEERQRTTDAEAKAAYQERRAEAAEDDAETYKARAEAAEAKQTIDWLTGLPNRQGFEAAVEEWADKLKIPEDERREDEPPKDVLVMMVDLDHFKKINDTIGHTAGGDAMIRLVSEMLTASTRRSGDKVYRYGGDEFGIMAQVKPREANAADRVIRQRFRDIFADLQENGRRPWMPEGKGHLTEVELKAVRMLGATIAHGVFKPGQTHKELLGVVDQAMAKIKERKEADPSRTR